MSIQIEAKKSLTPTQKRLRNKIDSVKPKSIDCYLGDISCALSFFNTHFTTSKQSTKPCQTLLLGYELELGSKTIFESGSETIHTFDVYSKDYPIQDVYVQRICIPSFFSDYFYSNTITDYSIPR